MTGSSIIFHQEIDRTINRSLHTVVAQTTTMPLLGMSISGMMLWTGWRNRQSRLKIRWNAPKKLLNFDLHQTVGIVSQFLLAILSLTGTIIVILHISPVFGEDNSVSLPAPNNQPIALSQLVKAADTAMPGGRITNVSFDEKHPRKLTVTKHFAEQETGKFDLSNVQVDRYSGKVLLVNKVIQPDPFFRVIVILANLHFGTVAGLPSRILYLIAGIAPTLLLITGIKMFVDRRWHRIKKNASPTTIDPTRG